MADIRNRVEEDRGLLKTIQTFVPGFRGYRIREDLRDSDRMLREQLARLLKLQRRGLEDCRSIIVNNYQSPQLEAIGGLISAFKKVEGQVAHAETGYSGVAADIQIKEAELNRLYEYDASMINMIGVIGQSVESLKRSLKAQDAPQADVEISTLKENIGEFGDRFQRRMNVITDTEV
jgi:hypothetical protein